MNSYLNLVSFFTIILNLGRVNEYKLYYLINVITSCLIGTVDYLQYQDCNYNCTNLLSNNNYYKTDILINLPYLQFLISLEFLILIILFFKNDKPKLYIPFKI